mmetsp:Transcript_20870/g.23841  ORF Transcript_20870/g.23841 Transcript_20870/m.23841 type:complete len:255 (-) Transcript_20870:295-1059(-)
MDSKTNPLDKVYSLIAQTASDLEDLKEKRAVQLYQYGEKEDIIRIKINKLEQRWIKRRSNFKLRDYTNAMEKINRKRRLVPGMVISQQASVCRSLHLMEVLDQDLDLMKDQHLEIIRLMHEQIKLMQEEKDNMELQYLNKLCNKEKQCKELKAKQAKLEDLRQEWLEKRSASTLSTTGSYDEGEVEPQIPNAEISLNGNLWSFFMRPQRHEVPAPPMKIQKRKKSLKTKFTALPPRSSEIKQCDRKRMVDFITS